MALTPFKAKAEERLRLCKDGKPEVDSKAEEPAAKRLCTVYEKQLAKLPAGDQGLVKDHDLTLLFSGVSNVIVLRGFQNIRDVVSKVCSPKSSNFQGLLEFASSFKNDMAGSDSGAHPAMLALETLGSDDHANNVLHCKQLESWFQDYAQKVRKMPYLYKSTEVVSQQIVVTVLVLTQILPC